MRLQYPRSKKRVIMPMIIKEWCGVMTFESIKQSLFRYKATWSYILLIVVLNKLYVIAPLYIFLNELVSPVDITVGMVYIFRDFAQRESGRAVIIAMLFAGYLSFVLADQTVAYASLTAFLIGEFIDWGIFTYTQKPLSQRLLWSAMLSAPVDSLAFLAMLGRLNWLAMGVMTLTKFLGVIIVWYIWRLQSQKRARVVLEQQLSSSP
jgi:uncharacterized PurR-regulated membrane protein YhhQ (DUF165 family)